MAISGHQAGKHSVPAGARTRPRGPAIFRLHCQKSPFHVRPGPWQRRLFVAVGTKPLAPVDLPEGVPTPETELGRNRSSFWGFLPFGELQPKKGTRSLGRLGTVWPGAVSEDPGPDSPRMGSGMVLWSVQATTRPSQPRPVVRARFGPGGTFQVPRPPAGASFDEESPSTAPGGVRNGQTLRLLPDARTPGAPVLCPGCMAVCLVLYTPYCFYGLCGSDPGWLRTKRECPEGDLGSDGVLIDEDDVMEGAIPPQVPPLGLPLPHRVHRSPLALRGFGSGLGRSSPEGCVPLGVIRRHGPPGGPVRGVTPGFFGGWF